jgi:hypothetical protein
MHGERSLTREMAEPFASACGLEEESAEYFVDLVAFNQSRIATELSASYAKLTGFRRSRRAHRLALASNRDDVVRRGP